MTIARIFAALAFIAAPAGASGQVLENDIVFALPCEQTIALRAITTREGVDEEARAILADTRVRLGSADVEGGYLDYLRTTYLEGPFVREGRSYFLIGKTEVTAAQYEALTGECATIDGDDDEMPMVRVSWYEAVDFTRALTVHLMREQKDALTAALGTDKAHARLPTEAEWEFAARGGLAVSLADFQAERFPMTTDLFDYAWFNDPSSADGMISPVGILEANPLGLHDIYGNAGEMMLEPFQLNKAGRAHGLAGGFIVKGGSFQEGAGQLTSAARNELPFVDPQAGAEMALPTVGFRIVIGGLALPSRSDVDRLAEEWQDAGRSRLPQVEDPLEMIASLRADVADISLASDLESIAQAVRLTTSQRSENAEELLDGLLYSIARSLHDLRTRYQEMEARRGVASARLAPANMRALRDKIRDDEFFIFGQNELVHELIVRIANNFEAEAIGERAEALSAELTGRDLSSVAETVRMAAVIADRLIGEEAEISREAVFALALSGL